MAKKFVEMGERQGEDEGGEVGRVKQVTKKGDNQHGMKGDQG